MIKITINDEYYKVFWETEDDYIKLFSYEFKLELPSLKIYSSDEPFLVLGLLFIKIYLNLQFLPQNDWLTDMENSYGFTFYYPDRNHIFPESLHLSWGNRCKIIPMPWQLENHTFEYLNNKNEWQTFERIGENYAPDDAYTEEHTYLDKANDKFVPVTVSFFKLEFRRIGWMWCSLFSKTYHSLNVDFNEEVGSRVNTWKGGTVSYSSNRQPFETIAQFLNRINP